MVLRGLVGNHLPFTVVEGKEEFDPPDPDYLRVTGVTGPYGEALKVAEKALNFTTDLRVRRDGKWGVIQR